MMMKVNNEIKEITFFDKKTGRTFKFNNPEEIKITERGWAGHFICSRDCLFRRNTLLEYEDKKWVISTVGCMIARTTVEPYQKAGDIVTIGSDRWYETMAFEVAEGDPHNDADVSKEIEFNSEWGIWGKTWEEVMEKYIHPDIAANEMHETVVKELMEKIAETGSNSKKP